MFQSSELPSQRNYGFHTRYDLNSIDRILGTGTRQIEQTFEYRCENATPFFNGGKCGICLETYDLSEMRQYTKCGHVFCITCLREWQKKSAGCPIDRGQSDVCVPIGIDDRNGINYNAFNNAMRSMRYNK
jgi:hypothetical protein